MRITLTIPFCMIVPDNQKSGVFGGKILLSRKYRQAKVALALYAMSKVKGVRPAFAGPVQLYARGYFPNARRRDLGNSRKLIGDALEGIVYADDVQVHKETWERIGIDRLNPRVELTIEPYEAA